MAFSDNIWITRKSRINTSERFKQNDLISQILIAYYSFCIILINILDIKNEHLNFEVLTLVLSILILIVSIFIFAMNYKERALLLKTSYIEMDKIYRDILEKERNNDDFHDLKDKYNVIVSLTENHSYYDYLQVLFELKDKQEYEKINGKWTFYKGFTRLKYKFLRAITIIFLFILPVIIGVVSLVIQ